MIHNHALSQLGLDLEGETLHKDSCHTVDRLTYNIFESGMTGLMKATGFELEKQFDSSYLRSFRNAVMDYCSEDIADPFVLINQLDTLKKLIDDQNFYSTYDLQVYDEWKSAIALLIDDRNLSSYEATIKDLYDNWTFEYKDKNPTAQDGILSGAIVGVAVYSYALWSNDEDLPEVLFIPIIGQDVGGAVIGVFGYVGTSLIEGAINGGNVNITGAGAVSSAIWGAVAGSFGGPAAKFVSKWLKS